MTEKESAPELSPEAKLAIQSYMLKFIIPSGVLLSIVATGLGFVLSSVARIDANREASVTITNAVREVTEAKVTASTSAKDVQDLSKKLQIEMDKSSEITKTLLAQKDLLENSLKEKYEQLAKTLLAIPGFKDSVIRLADPKVQEIEARLKILEVAIFEGPETLVPSTNNSCPAGTYAVAVNSTSVSGGRSGLLESINVVCRSLRFNRPR